MDLRVSVGTRIRTREGAHHTTEERTGKEDKETKRERRVKRMRESEDETEEQREGLVPYSYPSFARHHVERYTRIGDVHICEHAIAHSYTHTHTHTYGDAERTCDSAHEDVSRHRYIWPLYRVNVRSNALLNNVRPYARAGERRTFTSRPSESRPCERINGRAIEQAFDPRLCNC